MIPCSNMKAQTHYCSHLHKDRLSTRIGLRQRSRKPGSVRADHPHAKITHTEPHLPSSTACRRGRAGNASLAQLFPREWGFRSDDAVMRGPRESWQKSMQGTLRLCVWICWGLIIRQQRTNVHLQGLVNRAVSEIHFGIISHSTQPVERICNGSVFVRSYNNGKERHLKRALKNLNV